MPITSSLYGSFRQDFHQYYTTLCQYAYTILKDADLSEDVVQEVFLRVWEKKQDLIGTKELRFYLFTAVRNNCLTALEKGNKYATTSLNGNDVAAEQQEYFPEKGNGKTYEQLLAEALNQLPPKCREVFILSRMSKLTYQQIGDTLGISVKTVENQMGKALRILRSFVKGLPGIILTVIIFSLFKIRQ
ncbi:MAG: RNA polymerase sigma-70 factor [Chitinophagaceae bacterium]